MQTQSGVGVAEPTESPVVVIVFEPATIPDARVPYGVPLHALVFSIESSETAAAVPPSVTVTDETLAVPACAWRVNASSAADWPRLMTLFPGSVASARVSERGRRSNANEKPCDVTFVSGPSEAPPSA